MKGFAIAGVVVWTIAVGFGIRAIHAYETAAGPQRGAPPSWPADSTLAAPSDRATVVMFVHPECPCSHASLAELAELAKYAGDRAPIQIVLSGTGDAWELAERVPGAVRVIDPLGIEAQRFGARTSGHVVVYDGRGAHRYAGGITGARGHQGDNAGRRIVQGIIDGGAATELAHAVFGCGL